MPSDSMEELGLFWYPLDLCLAAKRRGQEFSRGGQHEDVPAGSTFGTSQVAVDLTVTFTVSHSCNTVATVRTKPSDCSQFAHV